MKKLTITLAFLSLISTATYAAGPIGQLGGGGVGVGDVGDLGEVEEHIKFGGCPAYVNSAIQVLSKAGLTQTGDCGGLIKVEDAGGFGGNGNGNGGVDIDLDAQQNAYPLGQANPQQQIAP